MKACSIKAEYFVNRVKVLVGDRFFPKEIGCNELTVKKGLVVEKYPVNPQYKYRKNRYGDFQIDYRGDWLNAREVDFDFHEVKRCVKHRSWLYHHKLDTYYCKRCRKFIKE